MRFSVTVVPTDRGAALIDIARAVEEQPGNRLATVLWPMRGLAVWEAICPWFSRQDGLFARARRMAKSFASTDTTASSHGHVAATIAHALNIPTVR